MPRLEFSERFVDDLSLVTSRKLEARILADLDNIEAFGEFGSTSIPESIKEKFGAEVRKVAVTPFDLIYSYYPEQGLARVEALIHQATAW